MKAKELADPLASMIGDAIKAWVKDENMTQHTDCNGCLE